MYKKKKFFFSPPPVRLDDSLNTPNMRKPLSGQLAIRIHAVKDVDHAAIGRLSRGPETFVIIKVEDSFKGRTKSTRIDRWSEEVHHIDVDKANEIELTVYDKVGDHPLPIGMLWVRISDIAEEMRRKKIESEFNMAGWVSADEMGDTSPARPEYPLSMTQAQPWAGSSNQPLVGAGPGPDPAGLGMPAHAPQPAPQAIDAWFALEPAGRIHLTLSFGALCVCVCERERERERERENRRTFRPRSSPVHD